MKILTLFSLKGTNTLVKVALEQYDALEASNLIKTNLTPPNISLSIKQTIIKPMEKRKY